MASLMSRRIHSRWRHIPRKWSSVPNGTFPTRGSRRHSQRGSSHRRAKSGRRSDASTTSTETRTLSAAVRPWRPTSPSSQGEVRIPGCAFVTSLERVGPAKGRQHFDPEILRPSMVALDDCISFIQREPRTLSCFQVV